MVYVLTSFYRYFWKIAVPLASFTAMWLLFRDFIFKVTKFSLWKEKKKQARKESKNPQLVRRDTFREG